MTRLALLLAGTTLAPRPASLQSRPAREVWEKPIAPGVVYRQEVERDPNRVIHVLRFDPGAGTARLEPVLAGGTVFEPGPTQGRGTVSSIQRETKAIAVINADYFPYTGDPLGFLLRSGEVVSKPYPRRSVLAWGPRERTIGRAAFYARAMKGEERLFAIDGLNEECPANKIALDTDMAGEARVKGNSATAIIRIEGSRLPASSDLPATVQTVLLNQESVKLAPGQAAIVGQGEALAAVQRLTPGDKITLSVETSGFSWERMENAVGGGPRLVSGGEVAVADEGFKPDITQGRAPRTAVGWTKDGCWILCVVDGRQTTSVGATLEEMAAILVRQGCVEGMNLDGGGSSAMNVLGLTLNRPSDPAGERPVADALAIRGARPAPREQILKLATPARLRAGQEIALRVQNAAGNNVPNVEILWSAQGAAWIDGGGTLRALAPGESTLRAFVRGQILERKITVVP